MAFNITLLTESSADFAALSTGLEQRLLNSLRLQLPQSDNRSFVLFNQSEQGELIGGLSASTSYDWLLIKLLWVKQSCRGAGLGKQLVEMAEQQAVERGCHSVWLDTSNPLAQKFYSGMGYREFGRLENTPEQSTLSHQRWFLKKSLGVL